MVILISKFFAGPAPDDGVERLVPRDRSDSWQFKVKSGVETVRFGHPGWRLGFTRDAINSYFVFGKLREEGILPKSVRFQISLPLVNSVITKGAFPLEGDVEKVRPGYEAALVAEIRKIVEKLPQDDIAFQWVCSWEITDVYGAIKGFDPDRAIERNIRQITRLSGVVPDKVELGIHLCFGTFGGWPRLRSRNARRSCRTRQCCHSACWSKGRLDTHSHAQYRERKLLRAARLAPPQRSPRLSRANSQYEYISAAPGRRAQILARVWSGGILRFWTRAGVRASYNFKRSLERGRYCPKIGRDIVWLTSVREMHVSQQFQRKAKARQNIAL